MNLINPHGDMYYTVDGEVIYNQLLVAQKARNTSVDPKFHFFEEITDTFDWAIDYTETENWADICRARALEIRRSYKKVRVWYSGGRDSYLALQSFINNDIFVDEIAVINFDYPGCEFPVVFAWLKNNRHLFHKDTIIKEYTPSQSTYQERLKTNWAENPNLTSVSVILSMQEIQQYIVRKEGPDSTAEVSGFEKPRVFKGHGDAHWTQYYTDADSRFWMGVIEHEPFFLSKTVPIFQFNTHHLINYIEKIVMPKYDVDYETINNDFFKTVYWKDDNGINTMRSITSESEISPYWEDYCIASLRTNYAAQYTGSPLAKLQYLSTSSTRLNTVQHKAIEERWSPELLRQYKDGVFTADSMYSDFFEHGNPIYNMKPTHSKYNIIGKYKHD